MTKNQGTSGATPDGVGERRRSSASTRRTGGKLPVLKGRNNFLNAAATKVAGESKRKLSASGASGVTRSSQSQNNNNEASKTSLSLLSTGESHLVPLGGARATADTRYQGSNNSIPSASASHGLNDSQTPSFHLSPMPEKSPDKPRPPSPQKIPMKDTPVHHPLLEDHDRSLSSIVSSQSATQQSLSSRNHPPQPPISSLVDSNPNIRSRTIPPSPSPSSPELNNNTSPSNNMDHSQSHRSDSSAAPLGSIHSQSHPRNSSAAPLGSMSYRQPAASPSSQSNRSSRSSHSAHSSSSSAPSSTAATPSSHSHSQMMHGSMSSSAATPFKPIPEQPEMDASRISHRSSQHSGTPPSPIPDRPEMDLSHSQMSLSHSRRSQKSAAPPNPIPDRPDMDVSHQSRLSNLSQSLRSQSSAAPSRSEGDNHPTATSGFSASSRSGRMNDFSMKYDEMEIDEDANDLSAAELSLSTAQDSIGRRRLAESPSKTGGVSRNHDSLVRRLSSKGLLTLPIDDSDNSESDSPDEEVHNSPTPNVDLLRRLSAKGLLSAPPPNLSSSKHSLSSESTSGSHGVAYGPGQWLPKPPIELFNDEELFGDEHTAVVDSDEEITLGGGGDSTENSKGSSPQSRPNTRGSRASGPVDVDDFFDDPGDSDSSSSGSYKPPAPAMTDVLLGNMDKMDRETKDAVRRSLLMQRTPSARSIAKQRLSLLRSSVRTGSQGHMSATSSALDDDELADEFDANGGGSVSTFGDDETEYFICCGVEIPRHCHQPSCSRLASFVVRYFPCFWCFPIPDSATDRTVLTRLNILSAFFALTQLAAALWLLAVQLVPSITQRRADGKDYPPFHGLTPNLWSLNDAMSGLGFCALNIFIANMVTIRIIQDVNLVGAIRYLWVMLWIIPFETFLVIALYDYHEVTEVWVKHWWPLPSLTWFRQRYCDPGTADTLCVVPILASEADEIVWCYENYQATNCTDIRDTAQQKTEELLHYFFNANVAWGLFLLIILFLIVNTLERIISRPMVQKSRESNVPAWLTLPILGCVVVGAVLGFSPTSVLNAGSGSYEWIGTAYIVCGGIFFLAACLGWFISVFSILSNRDKRYKLGAVFFFIILMGVCCAILTIIFITSITGSLELVSSNIDDETRGSTACGADTASSCSNCDGTEGDVICPEWTIEDTLRVLQTQTKGSASLSVIFWVYSISALRFGFLLRKHVAMYQIAYI